jgi:hypothetical protein
MYGSTRRARERIIAIEVLKLERRQALARPERRAETAILAHPPTVPARPRLQRGRQTGDGATPAT